MFHFLRKLQLLFGNLGRRLAELGAAIVSPIERLFQMIGQALFAGSEQFENLMANFGQLLTWPFRAIWQLLTTLAAMLIPESLRNLLAAPFRGLGKLSHRLGSALMRTAEAVNLDRPVMWLVWLLQPIWRPIAAIGVFVFAWWATRSYKQMLWGLPAIVMLVPFLLVFFKTVVLGSSSLAGQYRIAVEKALEEQDYQRAELYERKLAQLGVDTELTDYRTAETLERNGKLDEAYERMLRLAPVEKPGYPVAHYWILQRLLTGELNASDSGTVDFDATALDTGEFRDPEEEALRLAAIHLQHLDTLGIKGPEIQLMRAYLYTKTNRLAEAAEVLEPLEISMLEAAVQRMQIFLTLNDIESARKSARSVRMHVRERRRSNRPLVSKEYQWWMLAEELLGDAGNLKTLLEAWLEHEPDNPRARETLAEIDLQEFYRLVQTPQPNAKVLADLLVDAATLSSDYNALRILTEKIYQGREQLPIIKEVYKELMQAPNTPATIYEALGSAAASGGDLELAKTLLEQSIKLDASREVAWNNYAWVLSNSENKDLDLALNAVNRALELSPDEFRFRETRGQILLGLQKWQEAIADLEFAVNGMPQNKSIHKSLAKAYDAIGENELAIVHQHQAE